MAKIKKAAKELTPEEKLQQALVPVEEQPYLIPENWCWVKAKFISEIYTGNSINKKVKEEKYTGQKIGRIFISTKDVGFNNEINYETNVRISDFKDFKIAPANTALLCIEGGSAGRKVGFVTQDVCFGNKLCAFATKTMNSKYIYYLLQSQYFAAQFNSKKHGLIGGVSVKDLEEIGFMIPPLAEQQRIVTLIENLYAKLDEAKEKAQVVLDGFELRKSAILHKAFTGELTKQWRQDNNVNFKNWKNTKLSKIVNGFKYGTSEKSNYTNVGMPVLRIPNIGDGILDFEDVKYLAHNDVDETNQIYENDILIVRSNGSRDLVGKCAIVPKLEKAYTYASFLIRIQPSDVVVPSFLVLYLNSSLARLQLFKKAKSSAGINNINSKELGAIELKLPSVPEQKEIIYLLNGLFTKEQHAQEVAKTVLNQIDTMKKAILARAFRGELGTNNPNEESAVELLKKKISII